MPTAIVTGASGGLGQALTRQLLARDWHVIGTYHNPQSRPAVTDGNVRWRQLQLESADSIRTFIDTLQPVTDLRLLINNAGYQIPVAAEDLSRKILEAQFSGLVYGTITLTNGLLPMLHRSANSKVIFINSVFGFMTLPYRGCYVAAKHALAGYANALALELMETTTRVCSVFPGAISGQFRQRSARLLTEAQLDLQHSRHRHNYQNVKARINRNRKVGDRFTSSPEAVARKILRLVDRDRVPRQCFPDPAAKLIRLMMTILPARVYDRLAFAVSRQGRA